MDITKVLPVELVRKIIGYLPARKRAEVQSVNKSFNAVSNSLWAQQKTLFIQPLLIAVDYFFFREEECRVDETEHSNFRPYLFDQTELLVLPMTTRKGFSDIVLSVIKRCPKLESIYCVFASELHQIDLIDNLKLPQMQAVCPSLQRSCIYQMHLLTHCNENYSLDESRHVRFNSFVDTPFAPSLRSEQILNFGAYILYTDFGQLQSLSFELIPEISKFLPIIGKHARCLVSLELFTRCPETPVIDMQDFEYLSQYPRLKKLKLNINYILPPDCGLDLVLEKCKTLEKFCFNQPLRQYWFHSLQSCANTNNSGRLEVFTRYTGHQSYETFNPNVMKNLFITKYRSTCFRVAPPGDDTLFYSYDIM